MRNVARVVLVVVLWVVNVVPFAAQTPTAKPAQSATKTTTPVTRKPFTLHLKVDKDNFSDIHYDAEPYVSENEVYLFPGDKFGVNLVIRNGRVSEIRYQPDTKKADVVFGFEQPKELQDGLGMALTIDNKIKHSVSMEALMSIPGKKDVFKTSILPVKAGKSGLESWPHPISQLVVGNIQLAAEESASPKK